MILTHVYALLDNQHGGIMSRGEIEQKAMTDIQENGVPDALREMGRYPGGESGFEGRPEDDQGRVRARTTWRHRGSFGKYRSPEGDVGGGEARTKGGDRRIP